MQTLERAARLLVFTSVLAALAACSDDTAPGLDAGAGSCKPVPCPAPGFDVTTCKCRAPDSALRGCGDGTGNTDCCASTVASGGSCSSDGLECWTKCNAGLHGHFVCGSDGTWLAGHGLFPC